MFTLPPPFFLIPLPSHLTPLPHLLTSSFPLTTHHRSSPDRTNLVSNTQPGAWLSKRLLHSLQKAHLNNWSSGTAEYEFKIIKLLRGEEEDDSKQIPCKLLMFQTKCEVQCINTIFYLLQPVGSYYYAYVANLINIYWAIIMYQDVFRMPVILQ